MRATAHLAVSKDSEGKDEEVERLFAVNGCNHIADSNPAPSDAVVAVKNVVKSFPVGDDELAILRGISFTIQRGEFVAIVGPSGSGKSTLLNMMTGIDRPSDGEVFVIGHAVHDMSENRLATWRGEHIGIIFQFFQLLPALSLLHNVMLPMDFAAKYTPKERLQRAMHLLEMVGLADQVHKLPGMVSGGQQQRAAIARALANNPPLIVADEPSGNLDSHTTENIFMLFCTLVVQGKTIVMVTHDLELARQVPRVMEIRDGRITRDEVGNQGARYGRSTSQNLA